MAKTKEDHPSAWTVVGASVPGQSHLKKNIPCQDSHYYENLEASWGIAIVADGAGSVDAAHLGSQFVVEETARLFKALIAEQKWTKSYNLPSIETWHKLSQKTLRQLRAALEAYARQHQVDLKELSSTLILLIFQPQGLLVTHVGDGRAGYCDAEGKWKALIEPWRGEYANETVFISSDIWDEGEMDTFVKSHVIEDAPRAFSLLTDGCERHSFICNVWDEKTQKYEDPNLPFDRFFDPVVNNLRQMAKHQLSQEEMQAKWAKFLREGNPKLQHEPDDKTMIIGVCQEP